MARQNVFIVGATGNVGSEVIRQILVHDGPASQLPPSFRRVEHDNPTVVIGVANKSGYRIDPAGIPITPDELGDFTAINFTAQHEDELRGELDKAERWKQLLARRLTQESGWMAWPRTDKGLRARPKSELKALLTQVRREGFESDVIFVDATADNDDLPDWHDRIISETNHQIVTANKCPVADGTTELFRRLSSRRGRYGLRCTVMAGAQVVNHLMELYDSDEHVHRIEGCFSGSLGYICTELERASAPFSEIVRRAMSLKYTEPDPRDDLGGMDVARKLVIIARCLGFDVSLKDISVSGFVDVKEYSGLSVEAFLKALPEREDQRIREMFAGRRMRYVAVLEAFEQRSTKPKTIQVGLKELGPGSSLQPLEGSANVISIQSRTFPKGKEYMIQAPGAGVGITASGIRRDLLGMLRGRRGGTYAL